MTTEEQFAKLPKHAQETIRALRRELEDAERRAKELEDELTPAFSFDSRVFYEPSLMHPRSVRRPMPEGAYFHFRLNHGEVRVMLQRDPYDKSLYHLDLNADQSLVVHPGSTNSIRITTESRFTS
jgi:hypothetical protein